MRIRSRAPLAFVLSCFLFTSATTPAQAEFLKSPLDVNAVRTKAGAADTKPFSCGVPRAPLINLQFPSIYKTGDSTSSIIDPVKQAQYNAMIDSVFAYEKSVTQMANRYIRSKPARPEIALCVQDWIYSWANGGAIMGPGTRNGEYVRKWVLGSAASAWLQIRGEKALDPAKSQRIIYWMKRVANMAKADFMREVDTRGHQNNHLYWAAWGVGMAAIATDSVSLFSWAVRRTQIGLRQIQADGTLPLELERRSRAYEYHLYAAQPLYYMAEAAYANGVDLFFGYNRALQRLGALCLKNLGHGDYFRQVTNNTQVVQGYGDADDLGWVEIYNKHYAGDPLAPKTLSKFRPMKSTRLGGDLTLLYSSLYIK